MLNRSPEHSEARLHTFHNTTAVYDLLTIALVKRSQYSMLTEVSASSTHHQNIGLNFVSFIFIQETKFVVSAKVRGKGIEQRQSRCICSVMVGNKFAGMTCAKIVCRNVQLQFQTFERAMKFSFDEFHIWYQFALSLICAEMVSF